MITVNLIHILGDLSDPSDKGIEILVEIDGKFLPIKDGQMRRGKFILTLEDPVVHYTPQDSLPAVCRAPQGVEAGTNILKKVTCEYCRTRAKVG